jgi:hypothetical protein
MSEKSLAASRLVGARFGLGIGLFVLGLVCPVLVPLATRSALSAGWKTALSGLLVIGIPEVLWMAAAAVLGREGFDYVKSRTLGALRRHALPKRVSRGRYRLGLLLFAIPLLFGWLAPYAPERIPGYETHRLAANLTGDALLLVSLFVLGGEFWDKLRALFLHEAEAVLPQTCGALGGHTAGF